MGFFQGRQQAVKTDKTLPAMYVALQAGLRSCFPFLLSRDGATVGANIAAGAITLSGATAGTSETTLAGVGAPPGTGIGTIGRCRPW